MSISNSIVSIDSKVHTLTFDEIESVAGGPLPGFILACAASVACAGTVGAGAGIVSAFAVGFIVDHVF